MSLLVMFHFILHDDLCKLYLGPRHVPRQGCLLGKSLKRGDMLLHHAFPRSLSYGPSMFFCPNSSISMQPRNRSIFYYPVTFVNPALHTRKHCLS